MEVLHEEPIISQYPVSPNVTLNLILGAISGVTLFPLLVCVLTLIYHLTFPARPYRKVCLRNLCGGYFSEVFVVCHWVFHEIFFFEFFNDHEGVVEKAVGTFK